MDVRGRMNGLPNSPSPGSDIRILLPLAIMDGMPQSSVPGSLCLIGALLCT